MRRLFLSACMLWLGCGSRADATSEHEQTDAGNSSQHELGAFLVTVDAAGGVQVTHRDAPERVLFESLPHRSLIELDARTEDITESNGSFAIKDSVKASCSTAGPVTATQSESSLALRSTLDCAGKRIDIELTFAPKSEHALGFVARTLSDTGAFNQLALVYGAEKDERFVGFGEQFTYVDMRGRELPILVQEGGIGRAPGTIANQVEAFAPGASGSWRSTYAPMPYYLTNYGRALMLENHELSWFDLRARDHVRVRVQGLQMTGRILFGEQPLDVIEAFSEYSGRMPPLPDWLQRGAIVGLQGGTERVRTVLAQLESKKTPVGALWLQDWVGKRATAIGSRLWWNWQLNQAAYPEWSTLVSDLRKRGIRVMTYVNPYLVDVSGQPEFKRNLYAEAQDHGYLVKNPDGKTHLTTSGTFSAGIVDLTNARAVRWYKAVIEQELLGVGAAGYMADFGEALPFDVKLASGEPAALVHNMFPELWAKLNRDIVAAHPAEQIVFFSRAGFSKSPGLATLFWEGDQDVTWDADDGLQSAITGLLTGGISGLSLNHSDIGGYTAILDTVRSEELLLRWAEMAAFTPVFRTHEGNQPDANAQVYGSDAALTHFARCARLYAALADYRKSLMKDAATKGHPLVRHMLLEYPGDARAWTADVQFMLGHDVLVAPVVKPGATKVTVYLPESGWVHLYSGHEYDAQGDYTVSAPLGEPAVFYRKGSAAGAALRAVK
jgi:alpha-glucosidase